ncbi:MAG: Fe-S cluster assembly ATPase SufC [Enterobacterales bacterium]
MLSIKNLNINIDNKSIIKNLSLKIKYGEVHAIMGPNGSGKSTLSSFLSGRKEYTILSGDVIFKGKNLLELNPESRAGEGIFLAFQYPIEIPGISNQLLLQVALNSIRKYRKLPPLNRLELSNIINKKIKSLKMTKDFLNRSVNVGFSGGEKKRNEILQMSILEPDLCILDEIDSGLDIDSLKIVTNVINTLRDNKRSFIIITHYKRILEYVKPDFIHILYKGKIVKCGNFSLVQKLEDKGYEWIK